jgi:hypothetical protein
LKGHAHFVGELSLRHPAYQPLSTDQPTNSNVVVVRRFDAGHYLYSLYTPTISNLIEFKSMDVWFDHLVPKVKLNLGRTVVIGAHQMPAAPAGGLGVGR